MRELPVPAVTRYVQVLEQRAQQQQGAAHQARQRLAHLQLQMQRLQQIAGQAGLKNSAASVALHANAADFRSGVLELAQQCRDAHGVQQIECERARRQMLVATRRHDSMQHVLQKAQLEIAQERARQAQKAMDDGATQAWLRQQQTSLQTLQERTHRAA